MARGDKQRVSGTDINALGSQGLSLASSQFRQFKGMQSICTLRDALYLQMHPRAADPAPSLFSISTFTLHTRRPSLILCRSHSLTVSSLPLPLTHIHSHSLTRPHSLAFTHSFTRSTFLSPALPLLPDTTRPACLCLLTLTLAYSYPSPLHFTPNPSYPCFSLPALSCQGIQQRHQVT